MRDTQAAPRAAQDGDHFDLIIVGAGFAGMYMLHRARQMGLSAQVYEAGGGVGGTWYWNRYPGARCDVESMEYSYSFSEDLQQEWHWSERFAAQPEILRYAEHVADRFGLRSQIRFNTRVTAAHFDEDAGRWRVRTRGVEDGREHEARATWVVMATGCLSSANLPAIPGIDSFAGERYHTGLWPHEGVDFSGKRVGIIGTGSSALQSIPIIAQQAKELIVFQRTATYAVPARNAPLDPEYEARIKAGYKAFRERNRKMQNAFGSMMARNESSALAATPEERERAFAERWACGGLVFLGAYGDLMLNKEANDFAAEFVRARIAETVHDPETARKLMPRQIIGCKRLCIDTGYYETFNRPNVRLVDVSEAPIEAITPKGVRTGGREYEVDCLVFATGFDAMTGSLLKVDIRGRGGLALRDKWEAGPRTWLGLGIAGFPNLFTVSGPGSPSVLTNMIVSIEQHVEWISDCIGYMRAHGHRVIEATPQAEDDWVAHVNAVADRTLFPGCNSWYLGANVPGKPRVFMPLIGFPDYVAKCDQVAAAGYEGFVFDRAAEPVAG
jgi:cyclohexanone monooxygenase